VDSSGVVNGCYANLAIQGVLEFNPYNAGQNSTFTLDCPSGPTLVPGFASASAPLDPNDPGSGMTLHSGPHVGISR
jgi:hypothetical protein